MPLETNLEKDTKVVQVGDRRRQIIPFINPVCRVKVCKFIYQQYNRVGRMYLRTSIE